MRPVAKHCQIVKDCTNTLGSILFIGSSKNGEDGNSHTVSRNCRTLDSSIQCLPVQSVCGPRKDVVLNNGVVLIATTFSESTALLSAILVNDSRPLCHLCEVETNYQLNVFKGS